MKAKIIINEKAARNSRNRLEATIQRSLKEYEYEIAYTLRPGQAAEIAETAASQGFDTVVAAGGDGTVNEVLNGMIGSRCALGIIPVGLANDLAANFSIPMDAEQACRVIADRYTQAVDVISVNHWYFLTVGGCFLPCDAVRVTDAIRAVPMAGRLLTRLGREYLYVVGLLYALITRTRHSRMVRIMSGQGTLEIPVYSIIIGNQPRLGRSFQVLPGSRNDDGLLDLFLIEDTNYRGQMLKSVLGTLNGSHVTSPATRFLRDRRVRIVSDRPIEIFGDGEIRQCSRVFDISVLPRSVKIIVPQQQGE